jgi:spermidine synthase
VGLAIQALMGEAAIHVGVIGLGVGTLAAYGRPGDRYCFYEIDPNVIRAAQSEFVFLRNSPSSPEIIPGDARLSLESEPSRHFDILAVDGFSADAIPTHLLTREAFALYWRHLKPDGILVVHVTSRYLSLSPMVAREAAESKKRAMRVVYRGDREKDEFASEWVLVSSRPGFFDVPAIAAAARPINTVPEMRTWTDGYSNLYSVLR